MNKSTSHQAGTHLRRMWLMTGFVPNLVRNVAISSTEIVTYDLAKHKLFLANGFPVI